MTTSVPRATAPTHRTDVRLLAGLGFVAIFLLGLVLTFTVAAASWPTPATPAADVLAFFTANRNAAALNAVTQALAAVPLLVFSAGLARTLGGRAAPQLSAAGALASGTLLLGGALIGVLAWPQLAVGAGGTAALYYLGFLVGGPAHVVALSVLVGTTAVAGRLSGRLPLAVGVLGFVAAGLGILSALNFAVPLVPSALVGPLIPGGRFLGFVFIVAAVIALRRTRTVPAR